MAQLTAKYETIMVLSMKNGEDAAKIVADKFQNLIAENGTIQSIDTWGQRMLSYPINDETVGYYVLIQFGSQPDFPAELDRVYKITDGVLRNLIIAKEAFDEKKQPAIAPAPVAEAAAPAPVVEAAAPAPVVEAAAPAPVVEAVAETEAPAEA